MRQPKTTKNKTLFALIVAMIACFAMFFATSNVTFASTGNVAKIGTQEYATFEQALADANSNDDLTTIELLSDVVLANNSSNGRVSITTSLTINGNGHKITGNQRFMLTVDGLHGTSNSLRHNAENKIVVNLNNVTLYNASSIAQARALETRGGQMELNVNNSTLEVKGDGGNSAAFNVGSDHVGGYAIDVNFVNSNIIDGAQAEKYGYSIRTWNKVNLYLENTNVTGWSAVYMKGADGSQGSAGSVVTINNCQINSINTYSGATNSFSIFMIEDDDVELNIVNSQVSATSLGDQPQYIISFVPQFDYVAGTVIEGTHPTGGQVSISGDTVISGITSAGLIVDYRSEENTQGKAQVEISGGSFDAPIPDEYLADGIVMDSNGNAVVLTDKQSQAVEEINNYFDTLSNNLYTTANFNTLCSLKDSAINAVNSATTASQIDNAVSTFKTNADGVQTTTLQAIKDSAVAQINEYFASLSNNLYTISNLETLNSLKTSATSQIQNATSASVVYDVVDTFKSNANAIEVSTIGSLRKDGLAQLDAFYNELRSQKVYLAKNLDNFKADATLRINIASNAVSINDTINTFKQNALSINAMSQTAFSFAVAGVLAVLVGSMCLAFLLICKKLGIAIVFKPQPIVEEQPQVVKTTKQEKVPYQSKAPWVLREQQKALQQQLAVNQSLPLAEEKVEQAKPSTVEDEVVATTSPFEKIASKPSKTFEEKLAESDPEVVANYNAINDYLAQYKNLKARLSKKCQSYRKGKQLVAKLAIVGKSVRIYLALDPNEYATSKYHHKDVSDKKSYATTPLMLKVKSKRSQKYAIELVEQVATKFGLEK